VPGEAGLRDQRLLLAARGVRDDEPERSGAARSRNTAAQSPSISSVGAVQSVVSPRAATRKFRMPGQVVDERPDVPPGAGRRPPRLAGVYGRDQLGGLVKRTFQQRDGVSI